NVRKAQRREPIRIKYSATLDAIRLGYRVNKPQYNPAGPQHFREELPPFKPHECMKPIDHATMLQAALKRERRKSRNIKYHNRELVMRLLGQDSLDLVAVVEAFKHADALPHHEIAALEAWRDKLS